MSRVILGLALGILLAGLVIVVLERIKRSYDKGREDVIEDLEAEIGPVDDKA